MRLDLALLLVPVLVAASDLSYPVPPNPFDSPPPKPTLSDEPKPPPPLTRRPKRRWHWQPFMCAGLLAAACAASRPHEAALVAAIDSHHTHSSGLIPLELRDEPLELFDAKVASAAIHSEIVWVGLLGQWLPLLPASLDAVQHWGPALSAAQLLMLTTGVGYVLRRLLPHDTSSGHLATSFKNVLRRGRVWTLLTAAFSPNGLVHWLHAALMVLVVMNDLERLMGRWHALGAYAAAGVCSSLAMVIAQLPFRRRATERASVSGAVMGLVALRAALAPNELVQIGGYGVPIARVLLAHLLLDALSNPAPHAVGAERMLALLGGSAVVGVRGEQILEMVQGGGWRELIEYAKGLL